MDDKPTWSEQHRHECEARYMLTLSKQKRIDQYELIRKYRGESEARRLHSEVRRQHDASKK